jgi:hypothetical protein
MEQQEQEVFKVGQKYRKEEIEQRYREFDEIDFTGKHNGKPAIKVILAGQTLLFVKDGGKFKLV